MPITTIVMTVGCPNRRAFANVFVEHSDPPECLKQFLAKFCENNDHAKQDRRAGGRRRFCSIHAVFSISLPQF